MFVVRVALGVLNSGRPGLREMSYDRPSRIAFRLSRPCEMNPRPARTASTNEHVIASLARGNSLGTRAVERVSDGQFALEFGLMFRACGSPAAREFTIHLREDCLKRHS